MVGHRWPQISGRMNWKAALLILLMAPASALAATTDTFRPDGDGDARGPWVLAGFSAVYVSSHRVCGPAEEQIVWSLDLLFELSSVIIFLLDLVFGRHELSCLAFVEEL